MSASTTQSFLFADLAGFTALTEAHGDEQAADTAAEFCAAVRSLLAGAEAEELKTIGDAILIRIPDPSNAIVLGLRIVEEVGRRPGAPIVRVGMHTGTAVERSGDWFGTAVNVAARVAAVAGGDEVLLTDSTREIAGPSSEVELHRHGEQSFKNVKEPVLLYRALRPGGDRRSLAVDPVCRMAIEPGTAAGHLQYAGRDHQFCSIACIRSFAADPDRYGAAADDADE